VAPVKTAAHVIPEWRVASVPITVPICPPSVLSPLIDKSLPLMDDKTAQVTFRAPGGYLRLYIIAHKAQ
jgi:hypothetical protein